MKNAILKRAWGALLFAALLTGLLTGCARQPAAPPALSYAEMLDMMNRPLDSGFAEALTSCNQWTPGQDRIWTCGSAAQEQPDPPYLLASARPDGTDFSTLPILLAPSEELLRQQASAQAAYPDEEILDRTSVAGYYFDRADSLHLLLNELVFFNVPQETRIESCYEAHFLCTLDQDGAVQYGPRLQTPQEVADYHLEALFAGDSDPFFWARFAYAEPGTGRFTASAYLRFSAVDGSCQEIVTLPEGFYACDQCALPDGSWMICATRGNGTTQSNGQLFVLHTQEGHSTLEAVETPAVAEAFEGVCWFAPPVQQQTESALWLWNSRDLYRIDPATGEMQRLLAWEDYGVNGQKVSAVFTISPTRFVLALQSGRLRTVTLIDADALAGRPVVTLGVLDHPALKELKARVTAYNAAGPAVYVGIVAYTDAAAVENGFASGAEQLYHDILQGTAPDILLLPNDMDINGLVAKGLFLDLYPLLDADDDLARADFVPGILAACARSDTLPTIVPAYTLLTAAGSSALAGDAPGWDWPDYDALLAAHPNATPFYGFARQDILLYLLQMGGDAFIDRQAGQAHLDSPDFVRLLQASAAYPAQAADLTQDPKPAFSNGEALLQVQFVTKWRDVLTLEYLFDGDFTFKGFPGAGADNATGSAVAPALRLGVTRYCQDPQAAWQFVRTLLLPSWQDTLAAPDSTAFPLRLDALAAAAATATQPYEDATPPLFFEDAALTEEQLAHWQQGLTRAQADGLHALLCAQTTLYQYDAVIADILWEEAEPFYNGQRSAAEAAALMQDRVQTYLAEGA